MAEKTEETLWGALAKAQGDFPAIHKDKTVAVKTRTGGGYSYDYADLATILRAVTPVLSAHEIAVIQRLQEGAVETLLVHSSGGMISSLTPIPSANNNHDIAGSYTFFRRHALTAMLGIAADDDTNHASAMTSDNEPVHKVEISGATDVLDFLDDTSVPPNLDDCKTLEDLTRHLSRYQPSDKDAVSAAKSRINQQKEAA